MEKHKKVIQKQQVIQAATSNEQFELPDGP